MITWCNYDDRPAVIIGEKAYLLRSIDEGWIPADYPDVMHTARVMNETDCRNRFRNSIGEFPPLPTESI